MVEFIYNIPKNASTQYIFFEFNYKYYQYISYKDNVNLYTRSKLADKQATKNRNLIAL